MTTLLITTDFSSNSKAAIRWATQLAKQTPCKLTFYHVHELTIPTSWSQVRTAKYIEQETKSVQKKMELFLNRTLQQCEFTQEYDYKIERGNQISKMVAAFATSIKANLICTSTHGAGNFRRFMGTNASKLIGSTQIPVVIVPQSYRAKPITIFGYASDLENLTSELSTVQQLAAPINATIELYHFNYGFTKQECQQKQNELQQKLGSSALVYVPPRTVDLTLVENLQKIVRKNKPSALVMFSKLKLNWLERLFFSGYTTSMAFKLTIPLISIHR